MAYTKKDIPSYDKFMKPILQGLLVLGGSAAVEELNEKVYEIMKIKPEILQISHSDNDSRSEIEYRLAWARTYLKKYSLLDNSSRGVWALTKSDIDVQTFNSDDVKRFVHKQFKPNDTKDKVSEKELDKQIEKEVEESENWKEQLLNTLYNIAPAAFERLAQRMLRESGFIQVEVTGKTGDGGIDGKGIVRISGFLSFHVIFQCKRYKGSVTSGQIRDFRGAMQGRADKGLFITTGTFTADARKEATRDGAPPIDLIDGDILCDKLKELKLGVNTQLIESIEIKQDWFNNL